MKNERIRRELKKAHITQWQLADLLNISENSMYRKLRHELSEIEQDRIVALIHEEAKRRAE